MPLSPATRLGPYEILSKIGAGGMGEVYKARDTRLDRIVAIKISAERFSSRFQSEAHTIAALNHPHVCTLYDIGPDYLVLEYIEGETLAECLRRGPIELERATKIGIEVASALSAAHRLGIIHRDLKPANIMLTDAGTKLLDFGIAKVRGTEGAQTATVATTGHETILGTVQYMSPEQLEGKNVDARTDIFSFGAVLYEMLTGSELFRVSRLLRLLRP